MSLCLSDLSWIKMESVCNLRKYYVVPLTASKKTLQSDWCSPKYRLRSILAHRWGVRLHICACVLTSSLTTCFHFAESAILGDLSKSKSVLQISA